MKISLSLVAFLLAFNVFALTGVTEGDPQPPRRSRVEKPKTFTGPMNILINREETLRTLWYYESEEIQINQATKAMLDQRVAELAGQGVTVPVVWSRGSSSYGFPKAGQRITEVHARGEIDGHLISNVQSEITPNEVESWRVDVYNGNNHLAGRETLETEYITIAAEDGRAIMRMNDSFAANIVTDIQEYTKRWNRKYQPEKYRAVLTPMKWQAVDRRTYPHETELHGSMRGVFQLTHKRVEAGRSIILSVEQTMELLHITRPTLISRCMALLFSK